MSEITMKTIETLPLVEEPAEGASIVGWNNGQTVRMPVGAVGGSKGIVITATYEEGEASSVSLDPLIVVDTGSYVYSCNYSLDEFTELAMAGSPIVFVNTYDKVYSACIFAAYSEASEKSVLEVAASGSSWTITVVMATSQLQLIYDSTGLYEEQSSES